mgnify:CR=1 FL=1
MNSGLNIIQRIVNILKTCKNYFKYPKIQTGMVDAEFARQEYGRPFYIRIKKWYWKEWKYINRVYTSSLYSCREIIKNSNTLNTKIDIDVLKINWYHHLLEYKDMRRVYDKLTGNEIIKIKNTPQSITKFLLYFKIL